MRFLAVGFDHMHQGDLLRLVHQHPDAEIAGILGDHPQRMACAQTLFAIPAERVFTAWEACAARLPELKADVALVCSTTAEHGRWTERLAARGLHVLLEKPFANDLADADRAIAASRAAGVRLFINWPACWMACYQTTRRLIRAGAIGEVIEVHYQGGNRGPLFHDADKVVTAGGGLEDKRASWWYQREHGGGALRDYLGYGVTLGAWFDGGRRPASVTTVSGGDPGLAVDEHSITVCRYASGHLSRFATRWGTFTDPWIHQPTPRCGFQVVGTRGTLASWDYATELWLQDEAQPAGRAVPVDPIAPHLRDPIAHLVHCLGTGEEPIGPLGVALSRLGQEIIDAAVRSADSGRTVGLDAAPR
jgi:predicted dehydrogenase